MKEAASSANSVALDYSLGINNTVEGSGRGRVCLEGLRKSESIRIVYRPRIPDRGAGLRETTRINRISSTEWWPPALITSVCSLSARKTENQEQEGKDGYREIFVCE